MRSAATLLVAAVLPLAACDLAGPDFSTYRLQTINENALPFPYEGGSGLEVIAGGFEVHPGHDIKAWVQLRCEDQGAGADCQVEGDGRIEQDGIFNGLENRFYPTGGGWFPMLLEAEEAIIQYGESFDLLYRYERVR